MKYLSDYTQAAQTEIFNELGVFFAFSNDQFKKGCEEVGATKDNKVCSFGHGGYVLSKNLDSLIDGLNEIHEKAIKKDLEENGAAGIIEREFFNYETQLTMDHSDALAALKTYKEHFPDQFSDEFISEIFKNCWNKAVENDWF